MEKYNQETYGERIAEAYDSMYSECDESAIETLAELAGGGRALELGVGTGRIALPLSKKGVEIQGIDASRAMVAKLRGKPGGEQIRVTIGDFADVPVEGQFKLIYVVFNTFFALLDQEEQIRCFRNVASHLQSHGYFVIEAFVPDVTRFSERQSVRTIKISQNEVQLDVAQHDPVSQLVVSQHVHISEAGVRLFPVKLRYVWPAEMDLMARIAGMHLAHRWSSWGKSAFSADSGKHISVYTHP